MTLRLKNIITSSFKFDSRISDEFTIILQSFNILNIDLG